MNYQLFKTYTRIESRWYGYLCECVFGKWNVVAPTEEEAELEGMEYFKRYNEVQQLKGE